MDFGDRKLGLICCLVSGLAACGGDSTSAGTDTATATVTATGTATDATVSTTALTTSQQTTSGTSAGTSSSSGGGTGSSSGTTGLSSTTFTTSVGTSPTTTLSGTSTATGGGTGVSTSSTSGGTGSNLQGYPACDYSGGGPPCPDNAMCIGVGSSNGNFDFCTTECMSATDCYNPGNGANPVCDATTHVCELDCTSGSCPAGMMCVVMMYFGNQSTCAWPAG